jgi:hypothetical protein
LTEGFDAADLKEAKALLDELCCESLSSGLALAGTVGPFAALAIVVSLQQGHEHVPLQYGQSQGRSSCWCHSHSVALILLAF